MASLYSLREGHCCSSTLISSGDCRSKLAHALSAFRQLVLFCRGLLFYSTSLKPRTSKALDLKGPLGSECRGVDLADLKASCTTWTESLGFQEEGTAVVWSWGNIAIDCTLKVIPRGQDWDSDTHAFS